MALKPVPDPSTRASGASAVLAKYHSTDTPSVANGGARDGRIDLTELTRVIELYNTRNGTTRTGAYRTQSGTEDGFTSEP